MCACVRACVRECVRACVRVYLFIVVVVVVAFGGTVGLKNKKSFLFGFVLSYFLCFDPESARLGES